MEEYEPGSIRTYLMQMGNIPLLSRQEEVEIARRIERTRRNLRLAILANDYVLRTVLSVLDEVLTGKLRLEQAVDVTLADPLLSGGLLRRIEANRHTLDNLLQKNRRDFRAAARCGAAARGRPVRRRLALRRRRAARLVNEIGLRMRALAEQSSKAPRDRQTDARHGHASTRRRGRRATPRPGPVRARASRFRWKSCGLTLPACGG